MNQLQKIDAIRMRGRRKAKWDIHLNPLVTLMVLAFCVGVLLVWIGLFEHEVNPGDGVLSARISEAVHDIRDYISSII